MGRTLRSLLPVAEVALLLTAALVVWIRVRPLGMPATIQITLSLALLAALGALVSAVIRVERTDPNGGVDIDAGEPSHAP